MVDENAKVWVDPYSGEVLVKKELIEQFTTELDAAREDVEQEVLSGPDLCEAARTATPYLSGASHDTGREGPVCLTAARGWE